MYFGGSAHWLLILSEEKLLPSCLSHHVPWEHSLANFRLGTSKMLLDRHIDFTPFVPTVLPTIDSSQGNCLSFLKFIFNSLWVLGSYCVLHPLWGCLLHCLIMLGIFTVCPNWNLTRYLKVLFLLKGEIFYMHRRKNKHSKTVCGRIYQNTPESHRSRLGILWFLSWWKIPLIIKKQIEEDVVGWAVQPLDIIEAETLLFEELKATL